MRVFKLFISLCLLIQIALPSIASAQLVTNYDPSMNKANSPIIISGFSFSGSTVRYVQLFNESNEIVNLAGWRLEYTLTGDVNRLVLINLSGLLKPKDYIVIGDEMAVPSADVLYKNTVGSTSPLVDSLYLLSSGKYLEYRLNLGAENNGKSIMRKISTASGNHLSTFEELGGSSLYGHGFYEIPESNNLQITEILPRSKDCAPQVNDLTCNDYVKIYNPTTSPVDLSKFRLRSGYKNQTSTASNTYNLSGVLQAGHFAVIDRIVDGRMVSLTNGGGYVWFEDAYGLKIYENTVEEYGDAGSEKWIGFAWAYDDRDGVWKWTSQPTPYDLPSVFPVAAPDVVDNLKPCDAGQYRSPETNRCRKLETATALVDCRPGQYRSPETNRCRNIELASSELKPCDAGKVRSPETNRCRSMTSSMSPTNYAVEPVKDGARSFAGWWMLGGVGLLAFGYAGWEWRYEALGILNKFRR